MKLNSFTFVLLAAMLFNCQEDVQSSEITKIEFGTNFGMCAGYCTQVLSLSDGIAEKTVTPRLNQSLEEKTCNISYDGFNSIKSKVDVKGFLELEEVIGCPDCADGGSEWIEIATAEGSKKVTYEFGKEPKAVAGIISQLRSMHDQLGECE